MILSIIIPARNEAENIESTLHSLIEKLEREKIKFEIIVVDDGSTDSTVQILRRIAAQDPRVRPIENVGKHGYGYAVRCGLDAYIGDAVIIVMADASDDPENVIDYYYILKNQADCVFGSRWIKGSEVIDYPVFKKIINRISNRFICLLFKIRYNDTTNAFKGFRRYVIDGSRPLLSAHFNLTVELPLKAIVRGYTYQVIPIKWRNRKYGVSALHLEEMGSRYLYVVLNMWLEKLLIPEDYHRPKGEVFSPFPDPSDTSVLPDKYEVLEKSIT
jgi:dolichol-phosphate mannosyltransferase